MPVRDRKVARHRAAARSPKKRLKHPRLNHHVLVSALVALPVLTLLLPLLLRSAPPPHPAAARPPPAAARVGPHERPADAAPPPAFRHAPRRARYSLRASRRPHRHPAPPALHAVHVCRAACCVDSLERSLAPLARQSLVPARLTLVHACPPAALPRLRRAARAALADPALAPTSFALRPQLSDHACAPRVPYAVCVLRYLADLGEAARADWALVLDDGVVLEPPAVEKAWLSALVRTHVAAIRFQAYDAQSLAVANQTADPLRVRKLLPGAATPISPLPLFLNVSAYRTAVERAFRRSDAFADWAPLVDVLSRARILREALFTRVADSDVLSFNLFDKHRDKIPAHIFSELAFYRWSARKDEDEMYENEMYNPFTDQRTLELASIPHRPLFDKADSVRIFLVLPWMQMGGSEKCMLDIADRVLNMGWGLTFVLTMPFWQEDSLGEISLTHEWLDRALSLSSDTFDLLSLAPNDRSSRLMRYLLESRQPDYLLMANTRWAYLHSQFIKTISPRTVVADYNHMIHMGWEGGGMPRYGANNSHSFDLHLTASKNVASAMRKWIKPQIIKRDPEKVQPCYIGTDPSLLYTASNRTKARMRLRAELDIDEATTVVLFAGRFVIDKGIDVVGLVVKLVAQDTWLANKLSFVFVGSGDEYQSAMLRSLPKARPDGKPLSIIRPPAVGLTQLREYYAAADIFLLPSINEGIALVAYEAMAAGVLVISTDVGGQKELITEETGILLPNHRSLSRMTNHTFDKLKEVVEEPEAFASMVDAGREIVRTQFTTEKFCTCVVDNLLRAREKVQALPLDALRGNYTSDELVDKFKYSVAQGVAVERYHGIWNKNAASRAVEHYATIGIKTYVCDDSIKAQVHALIRSIRVNYPKIRVMLANDGPTSLAEEDYIKRDNYTEEHMLPADSGISFGRNYMVNQTTTRYFILLDDDHVFDDQTNLTVLIDGIHKDSFDIVGMRVRNLPGIDEYERDGIVIPRYVAMIQKLEDRDLTLCVWNENKGPSIFGIQHPITVDVLHNAFIASVDVLRRRPWRNELKVNEHMTFFLDAKDAKLRVGYLPSVFIHHRSRDYSDCYYKVRFREDKYRPMLPYRDQFMWDMKCQAAFPERVRDHILKYELDV